MAEPFSDDELAATRRRAESLGEHHWATWDNTTILRLLATIDSVAGSATPTGDDE